MRIDYNKYIIAAMLKQNEKKNEYEEQEQQQQQHNEERVEKLSKREIQILNCIKGQPRTEKQIAKMTRLDIIFTVSPLITELMLKGYVETMRRRRLFFFSREYCIITPDGLGALEQSRNLFENIVELIKERAVETIDNIAADSPLLKLTVMSAKAAYKTVKVLV